MVTRELFEKYPIAEVVLALVALFLFLANLDASYLWQDEAQRALIAKTVLHGGLPRGYDGLNFFSQELGGDYGPGYLWKWHPWLPFYVLAGTFLFKISTFSARLPFALFGLATVALAYRMVRSAFGRRAALVAAGALISCVPFLLLSRQCNYYSMTAFFSLLSLYGYLRLVAGGRRAFLLTLASLTLLFHSLYIYCIPCAAAMLAHALLFRRDLLKRLCLLLGAAVVINLPGALWYGGASYGEHHQMLHGGSQLLLFLGEYLQQTGRYIFPWLLFVPLAVLVAWRRPGQGDGRLRRQAATDAESKGAGLAAAEPVPGTADGGGTLVLLLTVFAVGTLALLTVASPAPFFRYLAPVVPIGAVLAGLVAEAAWRRSALFGVAVALLWLANNPLKDYFYELTHAYRGPIGAIVSFLKANAHPGEVVAITYGDLPVKFYTSGLRVVGGHTGEALTPIDNADWVIIRKHLINEYDAAVHDYMAAHLVPANYQAIRLDAPDTLFENRETPQEHCYRTVEGEDPVVIYRRVRQTAAALPHKGQQ